MNKIDNNTDKIKYSSIKEFIIDKGYSLEQMCLDETNNDIVTTSSLAKGAIGTVINIRCPARYKIATVGRNQLDDDVPIEMAYAIRARFTNEKEEEISPDTRIRIKKSKPSEEILMVAHLLYKDISITDYQKDGTNKIKADTDWYRFNDGILVNGDEHLQIDVVNPNVCIDCKNTRFALDIDFYEENWTK